jgi:hypothetical protein
MISSGVRPAARFASTTATGILVPAMHQPGAPFVAHRRLSEGDGHVREIGPDKTIGASHSSKTRAAPSSNLTPGKGSEGSLGGRGQRRGFHGEAEEGTPAHAASACPLAADSSPPSPLSSRVGENVGVCAFAGEARDGRRREGLGNRRCRAGQEAPLEYVRESPRALASSLARLGAGAPEPQARARRKVRTLQKRTGAR